MATVNQIDAGNERKAVRDNLREMFIQQRNKGFQIEGDRNFEAYRNFLEEYSRQADPKECGRFSKRSDTGT